MAKETSVAEIAGSITTVSGGLWGFWIKVVKPYFERKKKKQNEIYLMIQNIHSELRFNGGSSIKDAVLRLEKGQSTILYKLEDIEENQKISLNINKVAFWYSDSDGGCTYASPQLEIVLGRGSNDILGNKWLAWIIPEDKERIFDAWRFSIENKFVFDEEYTFKRSDGKHQKVWALAFHKTTSSGHSGTLGKIEPIGEPY